MLSNKLSIKLDTLMHVVYRKHYTFHLFVTSYTGQYCIYTWIYENMAPEIFVLC